MENDIPCPLHPGTMMKSKTGQYGTFWSHLIPNIGWCDGKKIKPLKPQNPIGASGFNGAVSSGGGPAIQPMTVIREPVESPDWDKIATGKVRSAVVTAQIKHGGIESLKGKLPAIEKIVGYIMGTLKQEDFE